MKQIRALLSLALCLVTLAGFSQTGSTITYPSSGRAATEAWVQEYIFDQLEKYVKADCDLTINNVTKDGNAFEFGVSVSLPSVTQYTIKIQKGDQKWFWYNVPYVTGSKIRIQNVPAQDSLRVTIRPTQFPTCYVSFRLDGTVNPTPDPDPDPDPDPNPVPCSAQPALPVITNITSKSLRAAVSATGITQINWYIYNVSSPTVNLRSGSRAFETTMDIGWTDELPAGNYGFRLEAVNCTGSSSKTFEILSNAPPTPPCTAGPLITSIYDIETARLTTQFHGNNVTQIRYFVIDASGAAIRTGDIVPKSATVGITFSSPIAVGNYTLRLEGVNCTGSSEKTFTVTGNPIPDPGPDPDPEPEPEPSGTIVAKYVTQGHPDHMKIVVSGSGINKTLTDESLLTPPNGYEFRYYINDKLIKQNSRLINYPWPSNVPVTIYKMQVKPSVGNIIYWGYTDSWQDPTAGQPFSYNTTCAYTAILFEDAGIGYTASNKHVQWMDYQPDIPSTDGKIWVMPRGTISTPNQLFAKGLTDLSNYSLVGVTDSERTQIQNAGKSYDEAVKTPQQLNLPDRGSGQWVPPGQNWPYIYNTQFFDYTPGQQSPLTDQQWSDKGNQYFPTHRIIVFENMENVHAIGPQWGGWRLYYQNLVSNIQNRFPGKWRIAHNYFTGALGNYCQDCNEQADKRNQYGWQPGNIAAINRSQAKAFLTAPLSDWPQSNLLPGGNMEMLNSACYGMYLNSLDEVRDNPYRMMYSAYLTHKANKYEIVFIQNVFEWHPNNLKEVLTPAGKFYYQDKMPHSLANLVNYAFISRAFMDGLIPFAAEGKASGDYKFTKEYTSGELWYPNGSTTPQNSSSFPYWTAPGERYKYPSNGFEDGIARGMLLYSQTWMPTSGGTQSFLRYRINGGSWVEPQNNNYFDLADAFFDKRAIVMGQVKDNKLSVMYLDPYADQTIKTVEYQYNGQTYSMSVASVMVHAKLHNL